MAMMNSSKVVCVTGGAGYIGSSLVKKLLEEGHIVHATLRNLGDPYKVGLLKNLPGADTGLHLFEADIYNPDEFDLAIKGCEFVFHVATPLQHSTKSSQFKNTTEAAIAGVRSIVGSCIRSGTVKRIIYTASVVAASPLKEDGTGYKEVMDESCWTPLNLHVSYTNDHLTGYTSSKTLAEKEILSYGNKDNNGDEVLEVVSLICGLVGGDTILSYLPEGNAVLISQLTALPVHSLRYQALKFLEALLGKVPILHLEDLMEAHLFSMNQPSMNGRFLCANGYVSTTDIADYFRQYYPQLEIAQESEEKVGTETKMVSTKLNDMGFVYKCDVNKILEDSVECAKKIGDIMIK